MQMRDAHVAKPANSGTKAKGFSGTCFACGKAGHRAVDCRRVLSIEDGDAAPVIENVESANEEPWVMPVEPVRSAPGEEKLIMVDSGSYTHVCPLDFARQFPMRPAPPGPPVALAADGRPLTNYEERFGDFTLRSGHSVTVRFKVLRKRRLILNVAELEDKGTSSHSEHGNGEHITRCIRNDLVKRGKLYFLPVRLGGGPGTVMTVAPPPPLPDGRQAPRMLIEWACGRDSRLA
eukprot:2767359-Heterocapsa_arctica.AAC.1